MVDLPNTLQRLQLARGSNSLNSAMDKLDRLFQTTRRVGQPNFPIAASAQFVAKDVARNGFKPFLNTRGRQYHHLAL